MEWNKLAELESHIHQYNIDIAMISESRLTDEDLITIEGYYVYTANHPANRRRGGSAIIINQKIEHITFPAISTSAIQCIPVSITFSDQPRLDLVSAYFPPIRGLTAEVFEFLFKQYEPRFLIAGDYNAKHRWWGNSRAIDNRQ